MDELIEKYSAKLEDLQETLSALNEQYMIFGTAFGIYETEIQIKMVEEFLEDLYEEWRRLP